MATSDLLNGTKDSIGAVLDGLDACASALRGHGIKLDEILAKLSTTPVPIPTPAVDRVRAILVSYFGDEASWTKLRSLKPPFTLINCDNGDATNIDLRYAREVPRNKAAGVKTFGYTHTKGPSGYGTRDIALVDAAIERYIGFYNVEGAFIDCTSVKPEHISQYESLCARWQARGLEICLNSGTAGPEQHAIAANYVMIAENFWDKILTRSAQLWEKKPEYRGKLWWVAHGCPASEMQRVLDWMASQGAGLVTITDDQYPNPYNVPPTYIDALFAAAKAIA